MKHTYVAIILLSLLLPVAGYFASDSSARTWRSVASCPSQLKAIISKTGVDPSELRFERGLGFGYRGFDARLGTRGVAQVYERGWPITITRGAWRLDLSNPDQPNPVTTPTSLMVGRALASLTIALALGVALCLILRTALSVRRSIRIRAGRCPRCKYDASGLSVCPECGERPGQSSTSSPNADAQPRRMPARTRQISARILIPSVAILLAIIEVYVLAWSSDSLHASDGFEFARTPQGVLVTRDTNQPITDIVLPNPTDDTGESYTANFSETELKLIQRADHLRRTHGFNDVHITTRGWPRPYLLCFTGVTTDRQARTRSYNTIGGVRRGLNFFPMTPIWPPFLLMLLAATTLNIGGILLIRLCWNHRRH